MVEYTDLLTLTTTLSLISASTERVVEIVKPFMKVGEKYKATTYSSLSIAVSAPIYYFSDMNVIPLSNYLMEVLIVSLSCGAGAGFWHNVLQIVSSMRITK